MKSLKRPATRANLSPLATSWPSMVVICGMGRDPQAACGRFVDGRGEGGRVMAPVYARQGGVVGRLQADFQAHVGQGRPGQQVELFPVQAVGAGAQAHPGHVGQGGQFGQQGGQTPGRAVGIGKRLQVGNERFPACAGRRGECLPLRRSPNPL